MIKSTYYAPWHPNPKSCHTKFIFLFGFPLFTTVLHAFVKTEKHLLLYPSIEKKKKPNTQMCSTPIAQLLRTAAWN